jgi:hypothetical protein
MASLADQYARMEVFIALFTVLRLLRPLKMSYEAPKKRASCITIMEELLQSAERWCSWCDRLPARPSRVGAGQYSLGWGCAIACAGILRGASRQTHVFVQCTRFQTLKT